MAHIAIVTGASSGIGREFVRQLDTFGLDEIWLAARRENRLQLVQAQTTTPCRIFTGDLSETTAVSSIAVSLERERPAIRYLINNAGFGKVGEFAELSLADQLGMVAVNVRAVVELTSRCLPWCIKGTDIIMVSSSAGFQPLGAFAIYAATKAFVNRFTLALAAELQPRGIHCMALCPGPVDTEFSAISRAGTNREKAMFTHKASAENVVSQALRDVQRKKYYSIYGPGIKLLAIIARLFPDFWIARLSMKHVYRKTGGTNG